MPAKNGKNSIRPITNGFILSQAGSETRPHDQGDFAIYTDSADTVVDHCWFRGGWFDPLTMAWESIRKGETKKVDPVDSGAPGASSVCSIQSQSRRGKNYQSNDDLVRSAFLTYGMVAKQRKMKNVMGPSGCCATSAQMGTSIADENYTSGKYKPWYSSKFKDVTEASEYWSKNYKDLYRQI